MSAPSFINFVTKRPWLKNYMMPFANWYANASGHRKIGLRFDDLIPEESETVQLALKRLSPGEAYDRVYRLRRAFQCDVTHQLLPKDQQTKPEEDYPYLSPIIAEIEAELKERDDLEAMTIKKK